jgi:hypothetical protein
MDIFSRHVSNMLKKFLFLLPKRAVAPRSIRSDPACLTQKDVFTHLTQMQNDNEIVVPVPMQDEDDSTVLAQMQDDDVLTMQNNDDVLHVRCNNVFAGDLRDAASVHGHMINVFSDVFNRYGARYSEALYQRAIVRRAYLDLLPVMMERELFVNFGEGSLLVGRIDLEVAGRCLYELKIGNPNIVKDTEQIKKYLCAYDLSTETIDIASLVYFTSTGVVVHEVRNRISMPPGSSTKRKLGSMKESQTCEN